MFWTGVVRQKNTVSFGGLGAHPMGMAYGFLHNLRKAEYYFTSIISNKNKGLFFGLCLGMMCQQVDH